MTYDQIVAALRDPDHGHDAAVAIVVYRPECQWPVQQARWIAKSLRRQVYRRWEREAAVPCDSLMASQPEPWEIAHAREEQRLLAKATAKMPPITGTTNAAKMARRRARATIARRMAELRNQ